MTEHDESPAREPVDVRRGSYGAVPEPEQFLWRGRLFLVRSVLDHWVESGTWCLSPVGGAAVTQPDGRVLAVLDPHQALVGLGDQREFWLVEAAGGRHAPRAVYELSCDLSSMQWSLALGGRR
ncbi:MAG: DUF6504 family protein [Jiangellaceae bacterium]